MQSFYVPAESTQLYILLSMNCTFYIGFVGHMWVSHFVNMKQSVDPVQSPDQGAAASQDQLIQQLMGVKLHSDMTCEESGETLTENSNVFALKCNITIDVNHLSEGLHKGLEDDREKNSEKLGRLALFKVNRSLQQNRAYLQVCNTQIQIVLENLGRLELELHF